MPTVSRIFIKASLLYLIGALLSGVAMHVPLWPKFAALFPTYVHLFVVGWLTQLIFGVALWLFPKKSREQPRGWEWLSWGCFATLNIGLLMRAVAEPGLIFGDAAGVFGWLLVASAALQWLGAIAFVVNIWPRIKGRR
ncbi:MAG: hypothetical protein ACQEVA_03075 [Myxococcota bacterium]